MMNIDIDYILERGVAKILPDKNSLAKLMSRKKITLFQGFDPTAESLHVGHFIGIRKLAQFQKLGHKVIFLIGDFTAMIGDPTDKSGVRRRLTRQEVLNNLKKYKSQAESVLDFTGKNNAEVMFNSTWLSKLNFEDVLELMSHFTVQQMLERDFFRKRLSEEKPIYMSEFAYPLMQGYDSVAMGVDLEVGGSDQLFNMLAGRHLMAEIKGKEKFVLSLKLLESTDGKKMGKTEGNAINLDESPDQIYAKVMSLPDGFLKLGIELLTDLPLTKNIESDPLNAKKLWAFELVKQTHGEDKATLAQKAFEQTFQQGAPEYKDKVGYADHLVEIVSEVVGSKSEAKRLILGGAVDVNEETITDINFKLVGGEKVKIGKKNFLQVSKN